ncbi:MAG TPA: SulP family inorganic anion transporter [Candidatus Binatia bacterium]|nr:SulP family inorganic anion transporter [Candidatus Binatia bacterium]
MTAGERTDTARDEVEAEISQPGLGELREAVANHLRRLPLRGSLRQDGIAGLNSAVSSVPDGMASGILAGVNPIYGLYACMVGPIAGGIFSSSKLMIVATTSAASLSAGQALGGLQAEARDSALFVMVVLIGALQILSGLLRMGQLTRFVSYSVMTGFIIGIAILTILSQLPTVTGYEPTAGGNKVTQTLNLLANLDQVDWQSLSLSALTLVLALTLPRTKLGNFGRLVAIIIPSALVALLNLDSVAVVKDVSEIPAGIPTPHLPSFSNMSFDTLTGALAVAVIILVQGAGVSQSVPNPDGSRRSVSRDFIGQGAANVASGFFRGLPVGGSLSTTALTVISGARSRWAAIFAGLWMALLVIVFPGLVSSVAMPALGALLILASVSTIKVAEALSIWNTGWPSRLASITTFFSTLFLPIQAAVGLGVVLSALLYVNESSTDVSVVELVKRPDELIKERRPAKQLPDNEATVLDVYGHLFYAGARTLERLLPTPEGAHNPVVILRLRGRSHVGATLIEVLANYADKLQEANGRLYLTGLSEGAYEQVVRTGKLRLTGPVRVYEATSIRGQSTREAHADAQAWLVGKSTGAAPDEGPLGDASKVNGRT